MIRVTTGKELKSILKDNIVNGKLDEKFLTIEDIEQRNKSMLKSLSLNLLITLPFLSIEKDKNVYKVYFKKNQELSDKDVNILAMLASKNSSINVKQVEKEETTSVITIENK